MKDLTPRASRMSKQLVKDELAYVESVIKADKPAFEEVLEHSGGEGNVLRVFVDAKKQMPMRAATLLLSAARIAQLVPIEQLQIIHTAKVGEQVNGVALVDSLPQFKKLALFGSALLHRNMPDISEKTIFAEDTTPEHINTMEPIVERYMSTDYYIRRKLYERAQRHGGNPADFIGARFTGTHTKFLHLHTLFNAANIVSPKRIVTVGPEQDRLTHAACSGVGNIMPASLTVPSVQVLTQHVISPFSIGSGGEQLLDDVLAGNDSNCTAHSYQVERDLQHFEAILRMEA